MKPYYSKIKTLAEPEGFEPSRGVKAPTTLAKSDLRPLRHGSLRNQIRI